MSNFERSPTCEICSALLEMFEGSRKDDINVSAFQSPGTLRCNRHVPLLRQFEDYCRSTDEPLIREDMGFKKQSSDLGEVMLTTSVSKLGLYWNLLLLHEADKKEDFAKGDILDPDWVDIEKIKRWKRECLDSHRSKCENPMKIWPITPAWLVDVKSNCIVPGFLEARFVALSYTYGNHTVINVDTELNTRLQQPSALNEPDILVQLPPTLQHAMSLTEALDERYLWVDILCINHGNSVEASSQLSMMGSIYANAIVTIIAADGNVQDGILGLQGVSESRALEQRIFEFGDRKILVRESHYFSLVHGPQPYFSRAWTFQEHMLAKRKLYFLGKQAHWQCQHQQYHEEFTPGAEVDVYIEPRLVEGLAGFPVLDSIGNVIGTYNECHLRYSEDALSGIIGLLSVMSRSFEGGFLYGIPEMFFDRALAWSPFWPHTELERRKHSDRPQSTEMPLNNLPSWSWIGWKGLVDLGHEDCRINDRQHTLQETYPITEWYTAISPTANPQERRKIKSHWFTNRDDWKRISPQLPGWTRVKLESDEGTFRGEPRIFLAGCEGFVYRHEEVPQGMNYGLNDEWFYPFPVQNITTETKASMPEQTPYLFARTQRARIFGQRPTQDNNIIAVYNRSRDCTIGQLHLHSGDQRHLFPNVQDADGMGDKNPSVQEVTSRTIDEGKDVGSVTVSKPTLEDSLEIEVVAISRTRVYSKTWNEANIRYEKPFHSTEDYNVLWVEWERGVAYRKAVGSIQKDQWERLELEDVDLILG